MWWYQIMSRMSAERILCFIISFARKNFCSAILLIGFVTLWCVTVRKTCLTTTSLKQFSLVTNYEFLLIHPKIFQNCNWVHKHHINSCHLLDSDSGYYTDILLYHPMAIDWLVVQTLHHSHLVFVFNNIWEFGGCEEISDWYSRTRENAHIW